MTGGSRAEEPADRAAAEAERRAINAQVGGAYPAAAKTPEDPSGGSGNITKDAPTTDSAAAERAAADTTDQGGQKSTEQRAAIQAADAKRQNEAQKAVAQSKLLASQKVQASKDPLEKIDAQNDQLLVKKAEEAVKKEREFARKQAELAHDEEIRKNLLKISEFQDKHKEAKQEESRLTSQIAELAGLAAKAM
ncbi:MAG: hypothetical protein ACXWQO_18475, partial [Bdellovibrionota bacterium]